LPLGIAHSDAVTIAQRTQLAEALSVDERAIGAVQIADCVFALFHPDLGVMPGHGRIVDDDFVAF
jgi:hypothetical protein